MHFPILTQAFLWITFYAILPPFETFGHCYTSNLLLPSSHFFFLIRAHSWLFVTEVKLLFVGFHYGQIRMMSKLLTFYHYYVKHPSVMWPWFLELSFDKQKSLIVRVRERVKTSLNSNRVKRRNWGVKVIWITLLSNRSQMSLNLPLSTRCIKYVQRKLLRTRIENKINEWGSI